MENHDTDFDREEGIWYEPGDEWALATVRERCPSISKAIMEAMNLWNRVEGWTWQVRTLEDSFHINILVGNVSHGIARFEWAEEGLLQDSQVKLHVSAGMHRMIGLAEIDPGQDPSYEITRKSIDRIAKAPYQSKEKIHKLKVLIKYIEETVGNLREG